MTMPDLAGKRVLITQADAFMGPTLCSVFAELGADVVADTRSLLAPEAAAAAVHEAGHIDVLLLNLAVPAPTTSAIDATDEEWSHVFGHMVDPMARMVRAALPDMVARRAGKILLMGSASALRGMKRTSSYSAARGAQLAYIQAVGVEVAQHLFPARGAGAPGLPGKAAPRSAAGPAGRAARGCAVCRLPLQRRHRLLRRPGVPGLRRLGATLM
jgi:2-keto-3-deoxy-L-fuconate dehydrogenase